MESSPVSGLGTLFASIVGVTTLGSLIFYILVGCYDGWKQIKEAKKLRVVWPYHFQTLESRDKVKWSEVIVINLERNSRREAKKKRDSIVGTNGQPSHGTRAEYVNHCASASPV